MTTYTSPGVFLQEISLLPPSVAEVQTAIPAFIGYTAQAKKIDDDDLNLKPQTIFSLKDFEHYFGGPQVQPIMMEVVDDPVSTYKVQTFTPPTVRHNLYYAVRMFYDNGGGQCYIVSVGKYLGNADVMTAGDDQSGLLGGLAKAGLEDEPTLLVVPEATNLAAAEYGKVAQAMLSQCAQLQDRFAILDTYDGTNTVNKRLVDDSLLDTDRGYFGNNALSYGAAYYPFLRTSLNYFVAEDETNVTVTYSDGSITLSARKNTTTALYNFAKSALTGYTLVMPASGAMAGVYATVDRQGVWRAPANIGVTDVIEPVVKLDDTKQGMLNVDSTGGKSINAIRAFTGKGTLVWGARTLDGNSNEWRYIPVRRFFIMVEESVKKATFWAVFSPNDANTWVKVRGMIESYLTDKWREGALAGATPKEAFYVKCGLGTTMNSQDILEGRMNVEIGMAAVRPAEFIILKFSHKLQTS